MRKILFFTLAVILLFTPPPGQASHTYAPSDLPQPITVLNSSATQLALSFEMPEFELQLVKMGDEQTYTMLLAPGAGSSYESKPDIPVYSTWILVPNGTTASLVADPGAYEIQGNIVLNPVQASLADLDETSIPAFIKDELTYATNANYPGVLAELEHQGLMHGQQVALLKIYPVQNNPVSERLTIYHEMEIAVTFDYDSAAGNPNPSNDKDQPTPDPEPIPKNLDSFDYEKLYRNLAINAEEVLEAEKAAVSEEATPGPYGWDYLIFTDPAYLSAANTFAAWKQKLGYKTLVTSMPAKWKAVDLQTALEAAYKNWSKSPEYVLLLGDAEHIPTNYNTWHPYNTTKWKGNYNTQGEIGTDFNYVMLDGDQTPDIFMGRISVDSLAEAEARLKAIKNYEQAPTTNANFYKNVMLGAEFQDGGELTIIMPDGSEHKSTLPSNGVEDRRFTQTTEDFAIFLSDPVKGNKTVKRVYYAESASNPSHWYDDDEKPFYWKNFNGPNTSIGGSIPNYLKRSQGFAWDGSYSQVTNAIQAGAFLVTQRGHGGSDHWKHPYYNTTDAYLLTNKSLLPVIWSINCQTGWFDNETDFKSKSGLKDLTTSSQVSLSEAWERPVLRNQGDYGAVGILAATRVTYGTYNDRLFEGMADALFSDYIKLGIPGFGPTYTMGPAMTLAKAYMQSQTPAGITETVTMEGYHWFGDPSMDIRTEKPPAILATAYSGFPTLFDRMNFSIHIDLDDLDSSPTSAFQEIPVTKVVISHPDNPDELFAAYSDNEGVATFEDILLREPGEYNLLAYASNHIPYTTRFEVAPGESGGIIFDKDLYTCSDTVNVYMADSHLDGVPTYEVDLLSDWGSDDYEELLLEEVSDGLFRGSITTRSSSPVSGNHQLEVGNGSTITVRYFDENTDISYTDEVEDTALIDCSAPTFSGINAIQAGEDYLSLAWSAAIETNKLVQYLIYRSFSPGVLSSAITPNAPFSLLDSTWAESYNDYTCPYGQTCYYIVRAVDMAGNLDSNSVEFSATPTGIHTYLPLISKLDY